MDSSGTYYTVFTNRVIQCIETHKDIVQLSNCDGTSCCLYFDTVIQIWVYQITVSLFFVEPDDVPGEILKRSFEETAVNDQWYF